MKQWGMCVKKMELDSSQRCASREMGNRAKLQLGKFQLYMKENRKHEGGSDVRW